MAFGNYFGYQPQNMFNPQGAVPDMLNTFKSPYQPNTQNGFIWVQGEAAAKSFLVAPNSTVTLWDSEKPLIYIKSADASGMPNIRTIEWKDYSPQEPAPPEHTCKCGEMYVGKQDFAELKEKVEKLTARFEEMTKEEVGHA